MTIVNSFVSEATEDLTTSGANLLVTSAGSIANDNGDYGVDSANTEQTITIDGLVYSVDSGNGVGVYMTGGSSSLYVNGQIQGDTGVWVYQTTGISVSIGAQGSVDGAVGISFDGNINSPSVTSDTLSNAGLIVSADVQAVVFEYGGDDIAVNSGTISGKYAIAYYGNVATETVENSGTIESGYSAITSTSSSAGIEVVNSGLVTNAAQNSLGGVGAVLYFNDNAGTTSTIDNEGTIAGAGYVIQSSSDALDISNSGTIHGGLYSTISVTVDNSGLWHDATGDTSGVFSLTAAGNTITNSHSGDIVGALSIQGSSDTIDNAGTIDGAVTLAAGSDAFTNSGTVDGAIDFTGSGRNDAFANTGTIHGSVTFGFEDTVANDGTVYGTVTIGQGDHFTNTGTIHGNIDAGTFDQITINPGKLLGEVVAENNDSFHFAGAYGAIDISGFVGTGTGHDTLFFSTNDFANYTALLPHMTQAGADVLVTLDTADVITLLNTTLSSLSSSDFAFT